MSSFSDAGVVSALDVVACMLLLTATILMIVKRQTKLLLILFPILAILLFFGFGIACSYDFGIFIRIFFALPMLLLTVFAGCAAFQKDRFVRIVWYAPALIYLIVFWYYWAEYYRGYYFYEPDYLAMVLDALLVLWTFFVGYLFTPDEKKKAKK